MSAPAVTDNFTQVAAAGTETTLAAPGKAIGAGSINLTSPASWPTITGIILAMRRVDSNGNYVAGTYTEWAGVLSGSTITLNTTPLYGTDQTYAADGLTQVYMPLSYNAWNRIVNTLLQQHTQAGAHVSLTNTGGANFTGGITTDSLTVTGSNVGAGWSALGQTLTYATNNGNKEFTCTAPADLTSTLSPGMRIQITRNTSAPTQCMAFTAASSQYATKASPTGVTFTGVFTCEAWVYLLSYPSTQGGGLIGRTDNATGGFQLQINSNGQVRLFYGGSSTFTDFVSTQSLPLNRWVHVAGVVTSVASKTGAIYINGTLAASSSSVSAATTLVQTSNLSVGAMGAGVATSFLNGYVSEARVWATNQSQSSIQSNMAISLTGSESNLVALFQGNGNFNDKTSNANNLTATNGPIATQANNPYNNTEYAIVTKVSYSNPTTTVTLFSGLGYTIPNMTLNSAQYSLAEVPFGWPSKDNWRVFVLDRVIRDQSSPVQNTWYNTGSIQLAVPTGSWRISYQAAIQANLGSAGTITCFAALSTANNTASDTDMIGKTEANAVVVSSNQVYRAKNYVMSALTTLFLNHRTTTATIADIFFRGDQLDIVVEAEIAY